MNHIDIRKAKEIHKEGGNITKYLREKFKEDANTSEIIEIAYDLQAGSYIKNVNESREKAVIYATEMHSLLAPHLTPGCSLLDVGTGELTTLSLIANQLDNRVSEVFALDISWSRLSKGITFWKNTVIDSRVDLSVFVADIKKNPIS